jgi:hypothetical protein
MLNPEIMKLADPIIQVQFDERVEQLNKDIRRVQSEFAFRGLGRSTALVNQVYEFCFKDVEYRAFIVWKALQRALSTKDVAPSKSLADDLKEQLRAYSSLIYNYPAGRLQTATQNAGFASEPLNNALDRAYKKVFTEIDFFVLDLVRRADAVKKQGDGQPIFYINSPVGAIQTGPSATASFIMNIDAHDQGVLAGALDLLKEALVGVDDLPSSPKEEVIDLIEEAKTEASKSKPNGMRLYAVLMAIATAIQTVGSLQPAYQVLRTALLPLGISLP